jgi:hypothetical protein
MARIRLMDGERVVGDTEELKISAGDFRKTLEEERNAGFNAGAITSGVSLLIAGIIGVVWDYFKYKKNR